MSGERGILQRLIAGPVSGDALAQEAGLTRAAMWKRIEALREAGVEIDAQAGRGYTLRHPVELLQAEAIIEALPPFVRAGLASLEIAWLLDSTNSELLRRETPAHGVAALIAERQTGGRGRRGKTWTSPLAAHLYLSLSRQFSGGLARLGGLSLVAGVATAEALHESGYVDVRLKWPNDLVVEGRKLGGLLVEGGGEHAGPVRAVIGLGLNVRMPETMAATLDQPWTDLARLMDPTPSRNAVAARLLTHLLPALDQFDAEGLTPFLARYAGFDALMGREVVVHLAGESQIGIASGIAEDGALRVRVDGEERVFHAGEVSVRAQ
ncbi:bifunctional biotin--[acetyl-CoA-carboxylase] ligase/biotin operon repressor BirA [Pseudoxanthomonas sacheonensis]|uniref:Bifunctional ligase/repressor BirA n=1 Tax=Pseudoxanthomonas sacheonensis TaxID=443615 RepID=A0ABU1RWX2_9GAMM|nr:bifunctional biotin--[acetyl-CoA-carboxylase] ligase/biotin operon repressor BirA [Pseudoxanthomonas sacheonensis]MDR6843271.1 BirA family biotin operon repressor/biotin-[acetyl-CoA-carboxylase] ligase [Pseudoxanthomonas sacheonensis]